MATLNVANYTALKDMLDWLSSHQECQVHRNWGVDTFSIRFVDVLNIMTEAPSGEDSTTWVT